VKIDYSIYFNSRLKDARGNDFLDLFGDPVSHLFESITRELLFLAYLNKSLGSGLSYLSSKLYSTSNLLDIQEHFMELFLSLGKVDRVTSIERH
jgi:hypothetical protein